MTFPRDAFRRVVSWPELDRSGIYILVAPAIGDFALRTYVGEARNLLKRLDGHERDRVDQRYVQIIAITSADDQLGEDITGYIEQRLIWALNETTLVEVDNRSPAYPPLSADARIRAERFFRDVLLLLGPIEPMMGLIAATIAGQERRRQFNRDNGPRPVAPIDGDKLYELKRDRCHAFAIKSPASGMRVLAGARVATEVHYTLPHRGVALRQRLIADGSLVHSPEAGTFILTRDVEVYSPAGAANLVTGRRMDGYHSWMPTRIDKEAGEV